MDGRVFETSRVEQDGLQVELVVQPAITYALVSNRVPIVRKVTLINRSTLSAFDLGVELTLVGPHGRMTTPWRVEPVAPVPPGRSVSWEEFTGPAAGGTSPGAFAPDLAGLAATDAAYAVELQLAVTRPDGPPVRLVATSRVLAHDEWLNHPALHDTLAAFVQPDTPAVDAVLTAASRILLQHTGSDELSGYQAGPARASLIAGAVYHALRGVGITYLGEMAPFGHAQRIRTVAAVLRERRATGLDLAVTYAACLERAGLYPLIWLTGGHAVGGFFLEPERLRSITVAESNLLTSLADAGRTVPVELAAVAAGARAWTSRAPSTPGSPPCAHRGRNRSR